MISKKFISYIYPKLLKKKIGINNSNIKIKTDIKKECFGFIQNRFIKIPFKFSNKRIACYNGKFFFSFFIKKQFVGSFFANFIKTKKMSYLIHIKKNKKNKKK